MEHSSDQLETAVLDELGIDVYSAYESERYFLSPEALHHIALALIAEFFVGLLGVEAFGAALREKLVGCMRTFRAREIGTASYSDAGLMTELLTDARRASGSANVLNREPEATRELAAALVHFGMDPAVAQQHAHGLAALLLDEVRRPPQ